MTTPICSPLDPKNTSCKFSEEHGWTENGIRYNCFNRAEGVCSADTQDNCKGDNMFPCKAIPTLSIRSRTIEVNNKCDKDIQLISTMSGDPIFYKAYNTECNNTYIDNGVLKNAEDGKCKNIVQYKTTPIKSHSNMNFNEKLTKGIEGSLGCTAGAYCRPGVNYSPVWAGLSKDNALKMLDYQGKLEFTFGADSNVDDNYDISSMLTHGCAVHSNPYEIDVGYNDYNEGMTYCKKATKQANRPDPEQVSHNLFELSKDLSKQLPTVLNLTKGDFIASQNKGCFNNRGQYMPKQSGCDFIEDHYACGWPYKYKYNNDIYYLRKEILQPIEGKYSYGEFRIYSDESSPTPINNPSKEKQIINQIRSELYECSRQQSDKSDRIEYNSPEGLSSLKTFIPFELSGNDKFCINKPSSKKCIYSSDMVESCNKGYMFAYDDYEAGEACIPDTFNIPISPQYTITFCPDNDVNCGSPSPSINNGIWEVKDNKQTRYASCNDGVNNKHQSISTPSITCSDKWSSPSPSIPTDYCNKVCPSPSIDPPNGYWNKINGIYYASCYNGVNPNTGGIPSPSIKCSPDGSPSPVSPSIPNNYCNKACPSPTIDVPYGYWEKINNIYYASCHGSVTTTDLPSPSIKCSPEGIPSPVSPSIPTNYCNSECPSPSNPPQGGYWKKKSFNVYTAKCHNGRETYDKTYSSTSCSNGKWSTPEPPIPGNYCYIPCPSVLPTLPNGEWIIDSNRLVPKCYDGYTYPTLSTPFRKCVRGEWATSSPPIPNDYCKEYIGPTQPPQPPQPDPTGPGKTKPTKHKHDRSRHKIDYYNQPDRTDTLEKHYASIHAKYSTMEELNELFVEYYKPNCSLHLDVPDSITLKNSKIRNLLAYPGEAHCFDIKELKKKMRKGIHHIFKKNK